MSGDQALTKLRTLTDSHRRRLAWFVDHADEVASFPGRLDDGSFLVSAPKGIYKPADLEYALSVRINRQSPYPDGAVRRREDGSWFFNYHQEGLSPAQRDREYTNRGLMACLRDAVPVGVLVEMPRKNGRSQYLVRGLAHPVAWEDGYFFFESVTGPDRPRGNTPAEVLIRDAEESVVKQDAPPDDDYDARRRVYREIVMRRGQRGFRQELLRAYGCSCAVTGCSVEDVLEAAHLRPYRGPASNTVTNGLLLRADIHTLLDLQLLAVSPESRTIRVSKSLQQTEYADLSGSRLREPAQPAWRPTDEVLHSLWSAFCEAEALR
ncbi:HNH endonuclease [Streptosporangium sp. NPDC002721]|uniref:HNH endonuclease n=1 Tax=Streptosporangium sp. NPDC002721 TaxID=3366188 RepID=UPI0036BE143F